MSQRIHIKVLFPTVTHDNAFWIDKLPASPNRQLTIVSNLLSPIACRRRMMKLQPPKQRTPWKLKAISSRISRTIRQSPSWTSFTCLNMNTTSWHYPHLFPFLYLLGSTQNKHSNHTSMLSTVLLQPLAMIWWDGTQIKTVPKKSKSPRGNHTALGNIPNHTWFDSCYERSFLLFCTTHLIWKVLLIVATKWNLLSTTPPVTAAR